MVSAVQAFLLNHDYRLCVNLPKSVCLKVGWGYIVFNYFCANIITWSTVHGQYLLMTTIKRESFVAKQKTILIVRLLDGKLIAFNIKSAIHLLSEDVDPIFFLSARELFCIHISIITNWEYWSSQSLV